jgi:hypothetical protein
MSLRRGILGSRLRDWTDQRDCEPFVFNAAFRLKPRRCRMLGGDRAHGPGPPRLERTSACAFAEQSANKLAHCLPGNSKHPGKLAPRPARQIVSTLRPSLSTMGNGEEDFSMKIQGTRSASAALALSPKSVGDPSGRNRPPVCGDDWSLDNPFAGFGDRASPFFDVHNSGSPSNRPPATNFSATACAMLNSEKSEAGSRVQAQTRGGPRALPPLDRYHRADDWAVVPRFSWRPDTIAIVLDQSCAR